MPYSDLEKQREAQRRYYDDNKEKVKQGVRDRRSKVVAFIQEYKQSRGCADCKIMYPYWVLTFDHLHDKSFQIGRSRRTLAQVMEEVEKCDVVCANCHHHRTWLRKTTSGSSIMR